MAVMLAEIIADEARDTNLAKMPTLITYSFVLDQLRLQGLKCHYYNSGAFGFPADVQTVSRGWIGPDDLSIRAEAQPIVRRVGQPHSDRLASLLGIAHGTLLAGPVWAMPKSHWAFELEFGNQSWLPALLQESGIDPALLAGLNTADAIEFSVGEEVKLQRFVQQLLENLVASDFMLVFPQHRTTCTVHSHVQLWWTTADQSIAIGLDQLVP